MPVQPTPGGAVTGLYHERRGHGPRLLFLNGSGATLETSALLIDAFVAHFDVLAFDQRGIGRSLGEAPPAPYGMADLAADAAGLLDEAGWDSARVFGVSFGGMLAQELAVTHPERIERLALFCTSPGGAGGPSAPLHEMVDLDVEERIARGALLLDQRFTPEWLADHGLDRAIAEQYATRQRQPRTPARRDGELAQLAARSRHDVWDRLGAITSPTFVGAGRFDGIAPVANSENIVSRIPNAELHVYEGGHLFFVQDPHALPDVFAFLGA
jgi:pimeloyl-ACP methyl ester carboxylesterase